MKHTIPDTPFSTGLSSSAKEVELRLRNIFQWQKKRPPVVSLILAALIALSCGSLVSCQVKETPSGEENASPESPPISQSQSENQEKSDAEFSDTQESEPDGKEPFSFAELQNYEFYFSSGAGAWATTMMIHPDGSFEGEYYDSDIGVTGDAYPFGTQYYSVFQGQFTPPVKINEYTYSTKISAISYENEVGTEEIKDEIRYIYTGAYGLEDAEDILIYLPGAPIDELPQEYRNWVGHHDLSNTQETEFSFYGLYNETAKCGFSGYDIVASLKEGLTSTEKQAVIAESLLRDESLTQVELNAKAQQLYELWDSLLNRQWAVLKKTLDAETMRALTVEELEWIAWKEAAAKEAGADVEGGSLYPLVTYSKAAEMTRDRVYELMELFD